ncbi:hypothetical protein WN51_05500 [Melipona quadrifasciata]|uniref:Uncharacterized protein n=1 Tax=Melipona quadrifasciata TaxID=166423 RepID=A0A0M9AAM6_9HYME|nr:hypothetical protein WN51_05500 [Melipona quadrifasciata]
MLRIVTIKLLLTEGFVKRRKKKGKKETEESVVIFSSVILDEFHDNDNQILELSILSLAFVGNGYQRPLLLDKFPNNQAHSTNFHPKFQCNNNQELNSEDSFNDNINEDVPCCFEAFTAVETELG